MKRPSRLRLNWRPHSELVQNCFQFNLYDEGRGCNQVSIVEDTPTEDTTRLWGNNEWKFCGFGKKKGDEKKERWTRK